MEYYESKYLPEIQKHKSGKLKPPPYPPGEEKRILKPPKTSDIIPLEHVPYYCRKVEALEKDQKFCSDGTFEKVLRGQLKLTKVQLKEVDNARINGEEVF